MTDEELEEIKKKNLEKISQMKQELTSQAVITDIKKALFKDSESSGKQHRFSEYSIPLVSRADFQEKSSDSMTE